MFNDLPPARTGWIFISKSGTTLETMTQFLCYLDWRSRHRDAVHAPATVITMPGERPLRTLAEKHSIRVMDHPPALGGRFSVLSVVGLLPAAIAGVDITMLRQGAATMLEHEGLYIASQAACWQLECMKRGLGIQIVMPYAKRLENWTLWYRQLWAESLGKGGKGSTPLAAIGPVDQHSMLQLFLDGPKDKSVTLVMVDDVRQYEPLAIPYASENHDYLAAVSGAEIVQAQAYGTTQAFLNQNLPLREIRLPQLDEYHLGALLMLAMLETVMTAELLGVDAFDQPAVEEGKKITFAMLQQEAGIAEAA
jgi:glucose-6-phosphate isomerase